MKSISAPREELVKTLTALLATATGDQSCENENALFESIASIHKLANEKEFFKAVHLYIALCDTQEKWQMLTHALGTPSAKALHQLQLLAYIYNTVGYDFVFVELVKSAAASGMLERLAPIIDDVKAINGHLDNIQSGRDKKDVLLLLASQYPLRFAVPYLQVADKGDVEVAFKLLGQLVKGSFASFAQLKSLAVFSADSKLSSFLGVLIDGDLQKYQAFKGDSALFSKLCLSETICEQKVRVLAFNRLATRQIGSSISYSDIASSVKIPVEAVERLVIDAIRSGLVTAKIDQIDSKVEISKCSTDNFGMDEWKWLASKLDLLSSHLEKASNAIPASKYDNLLGSVSAVPAESV